MEGGEEREPSQETLGTECPKFIVTAKSVLLADMTPSRPRSIDWANSLLMAAGQWDPALTRQEFWGKDGGEE